jgi:uroporphyrinogen-III decarboxylase
MNRDFYLDLAKSGRRMPIATHLVLHEKDDPEAILLSGERMAEVMAETARRFASPLALPVMDLSLEKDFMLRAMGIPASDVAAYHFETPPSGAQRAALEAADPLSSARIAANCAALRVLRSAFRLPEASRGIDGLVPVGMSIGPFSLLSKMLGDPIVPIFLAGSGESADDSEEVALLQALLPLCESAVQSCCAAQIEAGAAAIFVCEPAANTVFFSPNQIAEGSSVFDDFVIEPNKRLKKLFDSRQVDLLLHDCGSLTTGMVASLGSLNPAIFSFGSPVKLWEIESFVPKTTVIYGNLPTKKFYSDEEVPIEALPGMVGEIEEKLRASGHPFIVGSECDVLSMSGYEGKIMEKVKTFCSC